MPWRIEITRTAGKQITKLGHAASQDRIFFQTAVLSHSVGILKFMPSDGILTGILGPIIPRRA
jgi:hypothetical protein